MVSINTESACFVPKNLSCNSLENILLLSILGQQTCPSSSMNELALYHTCAIAILLFPHASGNRLQQLQVDHKIRQRRTVSFGKFAVSKGGLVESQVSNWLLRNALCVCQSLLKPTTDSCISLTMLECRSSKNVLLNDINSCQQLLSIVFIKL